MTTPSADAGEILRQLHWQCWRADAPPLEIDLADLVAVLPMLIESGSVGLIWPRLRRQVAEYGAVGAALEQAYQSQVEHNALVEQEIARIVSRLHDAGIQPVLMKGYAVAHLYPEGLVRVAGDIDLVVPDKDYTATQAHLSDVRLSFHRDSRSVLRQTRAKGEASPINVDLHCFSRWGNAPGDDFFTEAQTTRLGGVDVGVPRAEDHLRALCLHFLGHAAVRPLRLCDIALLLETRTLDLDWDRCLSGTRREVEQVIATLGLAHAVLGAQINYTPIMDRAHRLPAWLIQTVIRQWKEKPGVPGPALPEILANPRGVIHTFTRRWPDPITATVRVAAPFNNLPRFPVKIAAYLKQIAYYGVKHLPVQAADYMRDRR